MSPFRGQIAGLIVTTRRFSDFMLYFCRLRHLSFSAAARRAPSGQCRLPEGNMNRLPIRTEIFAALCAGFICAPAYGQPSALDGNIDEYLIDQLSQKLQTERAEFETLRADYEKKLQELNTDREQLAIDQETLRANRKQLAADQEQLKNDQTALKNDQAALKKEREAFEKQSAQLSKECGALAQKIGKCAPPDDDELNAKYKEGYKEGRVSGLNDCSCPACPTCSCSDSSYSGSYSYNTNNYNTYADNSYNCYAVSQAAVNAIIGQMQSKNGDFWRVQVIKESINSETYFNSDQVLAILNALDDDFYKKTAAEALYPHVCDKSSWIAVSAAFSSDSWWRMTQSALGLN